MLWFKHDSNAHRDTKLRKLKLKYGMQGYGLYWHCIELVVDNINSHNLTFEIEDDAQMIAMDTGISEELVSEMMAFMVNLGLFENCDNAITCLKILKRLDKSMTSNPEIRELIDKANAHHDAIRMRTDDDSSERKKERKKICANAHSRFDDFWKVYPVKKDKKRARDVWARKKLDKVADSIIEHIEKRKLNDPQWKKGFVVYASKFLNGENWNDDYSLDGSTSSGKGFDEGAI